MQYNFLLPTKEKQLFSVFHYSVSEISFPALKSKKFHSSHPPTEMFLEATAPVRLNLKATFNPI